MAERTVQLVLHYDGAGFSGWQRQPEQRTVQGVLEQALERLCSAPVAALGSGRTDSGVHARGQAVGVRISERWENVDKLRRALNSILPPDVWVAAASEMRDEFHARFSAVSRRYSYAVGTDDEARSPFRARYELAFSQPLDRSALAAAAAHLEGDHCFRGFAVRGTAPAHDDHRCRIVEARWRDRPGGLSFDIEANRFLHHMVRFLVGTMLDIAAGRRPMTDLTHLLVSDDNSSVSPPAPAHALCLRACDLSARAVRGQRMKIYLASADLDDVRWATERHLIDGVLTTHDLLRDASSEREREQLAEIVRATRGTVFVTVHALTSHDVYRDARELAKLSDQIVVQVPFVEDVIDAIHRLASDGVRVAATLVFSATQALIASRVGASAVVVPLDDLDGAGHDAVAVLRDLRAVLDGAACESDVIVLRPTTGAQFAACAAAGADAAAVTADALRALLVHPLTDRGVDHALHVLSKQHTSWSVV